MSKKLAPFTLVLAFPEKNGSNETLVRLIRPLKETMDLATNPVFKAFVAGSFSGTCSTILFQPLDLVKTRQQNLDKRVPQSRNMVSVMLHVLRTEHAFGLWRGIWPSITRTVPGVGLYFSSLHWLKNKALERGSEPTPLQAICLGMMARSFAGAVMIPVTVVKTRFESGTYNYVRMSEAFGKIYAREGVRGLCCGLVPTILRDAPYSGLYLMFYTQLKQFSTSLQSVTGYNHELKNSKSPIVHFSCGILAGLLASAVTHPADVIKTKMQLDPAGNRSAIASSIRIFKDEGLSGFSAGIGPRMLRRTLMSALAWTLYEEIMRRVGLK